MTNLDNRQAILDYPLALKLQAISLVDSGMSYRKVAQLCGISSPQTICNWVHDDKINQNGQCQTAVDLLKNRLIQKAYIAADTMFDASQEDDKIDKASTLQLVTAAGIMIDKARLMAGESTVNIESLSVNVDRSSSQLARDKARAAELERRIAELESDNITLDAEISTPDIASTTDPEDNKLTNSLSDCPTSQ